MLITNSNTALTVHQYSKTCQHKLMT